MGFIPSLVDIAMQKLYLLLLLLNVIKSAALHLLITTLIILSILSFFIVSRVDKAFSADTVNLGSITGLIKLKYENSWYLYPASRLNINNKMRSVKLSPCVVARWANDSLFSKNERFFRCV